MPAQRQQRRWTEAEFLAGRDAAPPGERWELVDGEALVTPSPRWVHQDIVVRLAALLLDYVRRNALGRTLTAPLDVRLEPGLVLQPDILVVPAGDLRTRDAVVRRLLLAVEVLSPGSARYDRVTKRPTYRRNRVPEYWIVDESSQTVERWRPDDSRPELVSDILIWQPDVTIVPFTLDLPPFFDDVLAEDGE